MTTENLRDDLAAIPGVVSSEVTIKYDETQVAQVMLDGTEDAPEVGDLVGALLGPNLPDVDVDAGETPRKRGGLGRGLVDLLPEDDSHPVPSQLQPEAKSRSAVSRVSVVESSSDVFVTVSDNRDREVSVSVGEDGSIDAAVTSAVRQLFGVDGSITVSIDEVAVSDGSILVASASNGFARSAGAAFVEFGRPSAVARAVFQAVAGMP